MRGEGLLIGLMDLGFVCKLGKMLGKRGRAIKDNQERMIEASVNGRFCGAVYWREFVGMRRMVWRMGWGFKRERG